ncbi:hypothetical protein AB0B40_34620 [Streptomyces sp. NPDC042638]|uniref:hypothetical protein n=1 Tax=Streptomyces sp. NPDC042638 TaxID=3154333 RepID=UPI00340A1772
MQTDLDLHPDGDGFVARLTPHAAGAMHEALSHVGRGGASDACLTVLLGTDRAAVGELMERLHGPHTEPLELRFTLRELHTLLSALTNAPTQFVSPEGIFFQEPFFIRLGFYRQNFDALARAIANAVSHALEVNS